MTDKVLLELQGIYEVGQRLYKTRSATSVVLREHSNVTRLQEKFDGVFYVLFCPAECAGGVKFGYKAKP